MEGVKALAVTVPEALADPFGCLEGASVGVVEDLEAEDLEALGGLGAVCPEEEAPAGAGEDLSTEAAQAKMGNKAVYWPFIHFCPRSKLPFQALSNDNLTLLGTYPGPRPSWFDRSWFRRFCPTPHPGSRRQHPDQMGQQPNPYPWQIPGNLPGLGTGWIGRISNGSF